MHLYLVTANEFYPAEEVLVKMKEALPPIEALQRILKRCTQIDKIQEAAEKSSHA